MSNRQLVCHWFCAAFFAGTRNFGKHMKKQHSWQALWKTKDMFCRISEKPVQVLVRFIIQMIGVLETTKMRTHTSTNPFENVLNALSGRMHVRRHVQCDILSLNESTWFIHCLRCAEIISISVNYQWHNSNVYYGISVKRWKCAQWKQMWSSR